MSIAKKNAFELFEMCKFAVACDTFMIRLDTLLPLSLNQLTNIQRTFS